MTLEQQIATLAKLGFHLNEGVTIDDLLYSMPRADYERDNFRPILFRYGGYVESEPYYRLICLKIWHFDTECIEKTGDYVKIIQALCRISGQTERITDIVDFVNLESDTAWLEYTVNGERRHWTIEVNDDWADTLTLCYIRQDLVDEEHRFYSMSGGQSMLLFYLDEQTANALNLLTKNALETIDF